jgi:cytochrome P450
MAQAREVGAVTATRPVVRVDTYDLATTLLRDPRLRPGTTGLIDRLTPEWRRHPSLVLLTEMIVLDMPPRHGAVRAALQDWFGPTAAEGMRGRIQGIVDRMLDGLDGNAGPIDFIERFARPLPFTVIGDVIGIPEADHYRIGRRAAALMAAMWHSVPDLTRANGSAVVLDQYFRKLIAASRERPGERNLIADLTEVAGLDDHEIVANLTFLVMGATFTTGDFLGSAMVRALREPALRDRLRDHADVDACVEEALRLDPPIGRLLRNAAADIEIGGLRIPEGSLIEFDLIAANRDPARFDDPAAFDPDRSDGRALSFGYGAHYCAGWAVGKAEAATLLPEFWRRFPDTRLVDEPTRKEHVILNGYACVPIDPLSKESS